MTIEMAALGVRVGHQIVSVDAKLDSGVQTCRPRMVWQSHRTLRYACDAMTDVGVSMDVSIVIQEQDRSPCDPSCPQAFLEERESLMQCQSRTAN